MVGETAEQVISLISEGLTPLRSGLWRRAYRALSGDDADMLEADAAAPDSTPTIDHMRGSLGKAKELKQKVDDERFTFEFRGKKHVLVDVCGEIVEGIMEFEKFIDKGVAMDHSGKAALPWAAIKIVLGCLVNNHKQNTTVAAGLATVTAAIAYYAKLELLYFHEDPTPDAGSQSPGQPDDTPDDELADRPLADHLRDAIVEVYKQILLFLSEARRFYHEGRASQQESNESPGQEIDQGNKAKNRTLRVTRKVVRGLKSTGTAVGRAVFDSSERYSAIIEAVEGGRAKVDMWTNLVRRESQLKLMNQADEIFDSLNRRGDSKFLRWISDISSITDHARISESRFSGTGLWLLLREEYEKWKHLMEKSALWLYGPLGTGKTTLTSLIIDSFLDDWEPRQSSPVIFFYCDPPLDADQARRPADQPGRFRTADQCARDMLRQLTQLSSPRPAALKHAYGARKQLSGRQCLDFIETMVGDYESITFVLDALDKCAPPEGSDLGALNHVELLERLVLIAKKKEKGRVRVLISTQGQHDWAGRVFVDNPALTVHRISVDSQPPDDIRRFVTLSIRKWTPANFLPRESDVRRERAKDAVVETITKGAATMYLWASLVLNRIRNNKNLRNEADVLHELKTVQLPMDIQQSYEQIYNGLTGDAATPSSRRAEDAIRLLYCARKPLNTRALVDAVWSKNADRWSADHRGETDDLILCSGGLIVEDRRLDVLRLFHPSVERFLASRPGYEAETHDVMAEACMQRIITARRLSTRAGRTAQQDATGVQQRGRRAERMPAGPSAATMESRSRSRSRSRGHHGHKDRLQDDDSHNRPLLRPLLFGSPDTRSPRVLSVQELCDAFPVHESLISDSYSDPDSEDDRGNPAGTLVPPRGRRRNPDRETDSDSDLEFLRARIFDAQWSLAGGLDGSDFTSDSDSDSDNDAGESSMARVKKSNVLQDFVEYATIYWATHYSLGREDKGEYPWFTTNLVEFLNTNTAWWMNNAQKLLSQRPLGFYDGAVERELEHCMSNPSDGLFISCVYGFVDVVGSYVKEYPDILARARELPPDNDYWAPRRGLDAANTLGLSPFHVAAKFSRMSILQILARMETKPPTFRERDRVYEKFAIQHALENFRTAPRRAELVDIFGGDLDQFQSKALLSAMENPFCPRQLVDVVRGGQSSRVVPRACLPMVVAPYVYRILDWIKGGSKHVDSSPGENLAMAVVRYAYGTVDLIKAVLKHVEITEEVLVAAASWKNPGGVEWDARRPVWDYLLSDLESKYRVSDLVVMAAIKAGDAGLVEYLLTSAVSLTRAPVVGYGACEQGMFRPLAYFLPARGTDTMSQALAKAVSHKQNAADLVAVLLDWENQIEITQHVVEAALKSPAVDVDLLRLLGRMDCDITDGMLLAMARNRERGSELLQCVKELYSATRSIDPESLRLVYTTKVIGRALEAANVPFLRRLLPATEHGVLDRIERSKHFVRALQKSPGMLGTRSSSTATSQSQRLQWSRPEHYWDAQTAEAIQLLLGHFQSTHGRRPGFSRARHLHPAVWTHGPRVVDLLCRFLSDRRRRSDPSAQDLLATACGNTLYGHDVMKVITERLEGALPIEQSVFYSAAEHGTIRVLSFLFQKDRQTRLFATEDVALQAARNPDIEALDLLFRMIGTVSRRDLRAAAMNSDEALSRLLHASGAPSPPDLSLLKTIAQHCSRASTLQRALDAHGPLDDEGGDRHADAEKGLIDAAIQNRHGIDMLLFLFSRFPSVRVTTTMLVRAAASRVAAPEMLRVLLNRCGDAELDELITPEVLATAARNGAEAPQALRMLLMEGDTARKVKSEVIEAAKANAVSREKTLEVLGSFSWN